VNAKQDHILQAALGLFAAEGLAVPTAKIATKAGVANGTLFNYFPTKQDLIDALYLNNKKEVAQLFLAGGAGKAKSLREISFVAWNSYVRWAINNPLKHEVMNLFKTAHVLSPKVLAEVDDIFQPLHESVLNGMKRGEMVNLSLDYWCQIKGAQIGVSIEQALGQKLKGKTLETHILTGFDIYWRGVAL
jgi:AcrR family transcriptional regulator